MCSLIHTPPDPSSTVPIMEEPSRVENVILDPAPFCYAPMNEIRLGVSICDILDAIDFLEVGILSPYGSSMHS